MTAYRQVTIGSLTQKQLKTAASGKAISLTKAQIAGSGTTFYTHVENHKKIQSAKKRGTGTRIHICEGAIHHDLMHGGSLWSWLSKSGEDIYKFGKKTWNNHKDVIKPVLSRIADVGVPMLATSMLGDPTAAGPMRGLLRSMTGIGVSKKLVKGSQQARDHMKMIRSKKSGRSGLSVASATLPTVKRGSGIILT